MEQLENLRIENETLKHELEIRPPADQVISEKVRRQLEENLALRQVVIKCLDAIEGKLLAGDKSGKLWLNLQRFNHIS